MTEIPPDMNLNPGRVVIVHFFLFALDNKSQVDPRVQRALQINPSFNKSVLSLRSLLEKKKGEMGGRERRKGSQRKRNILNPVITGSFSCLLSLRFTFNPILANPICLSRLPPELLLVLSSFSKYAFWSP